MIRTAIVLVLTGLCQLPSPARAQGEVHCRLRVLALGDPPPFVQEVRNGVRYEVAPPAGEIPPRNAGILPGGSTAGAPIGIRVRLGRVSEQVEFTLPNRNVAGILDDEGDKWLEVPLHECGASLVLAWRKGKTWKEAAALVIPDDATARAEGSIHLTNLAAGPMAVVIGEEKIRLNPGVTITRQQAVGSPALPLEISYPSATGGLVLCHTAMLEPVGGTFKRFIIHMADGKRPKLPVKVVRIEEASGSSEIVSNSGSASSTRR
ncbi:MAG: hypothetical protein J0M04_17005 [Verrucomicrobia bacterium]|nr:hypothetical protein [Verrucomicrobiota bacterium]